MEIILRTTKFELPPPTKTIKTNKDQDISTLAKILPPLKRKPQV